MGLSSLKIYQYDADLTMQDRMEVLDISSIALVLQENYPSGLCLRGPYCYSVPTVTVYNVVPYQDSLGEIATRADTHTKLILYRTIGNKNAFNLLLYYLQFRALCRVSGYRARVVLAEYLHLPPQFSTKLSATINSR